MEKIVTQKEVATSVVQTLQAGGYMALFAGGCVRDEMLGRVPKDYDVATDALPDEVEALFPKTIPIGKAFGVIAVIDRGETVEVATFREEVGTLDGRHPESIKFAAAKEDALRRDFTINGMFFDPVSEQLYDYVDGRKDLKKKRIAAIGNPTERFREDHLRMLRAVRFVHTLQFTLAPETEAAIQAMAPLIKKISAERIEQELTRTLTESPRPGTALKHLHTLGLLEHILPELLPMIGQQQPPQFHPEGDVFEHTCLMLDAMNQPAAPVEQTFQSAHPDEELAQNPFRPVESSPALHTSHRRLPHWEQENRIYFVTFRLADAIAKPKLLQWKEELEIWKNTLPDPSSEPVLSEASRRYRKKQQEWLDQGHGTCLLKKPELSALVEQTLLHFDGDRYQLGPYVVMPNHVHLILRPRSEHSLSAVMKSIKGFSAREINKHLKRRGSLWMDESFDHIIRNMTYYEKFTTYIADNPARAGLPEIGYRLGCGTLTLDGQTGKSAPPEEQTFPAVQAAYTARELAYTVLLHDVGKPATASFGPGADGQNRIRFDGHAAVSARMAEEILIRLKFPNVEKKHIITAVAGHMRFMDVQKMKASTLRKMIGSDTFELEMALHRLDCLGSHRLLENYDFVRAYQEKMADEPILPKPLITGRDLLDLGIREGKLVGRILKEAYDGQMEQRFHSKADVLAWVQAEYLDQSST
ncbi:transposase [Pontiella sp.]|uniref:transposase n=1 Tax=Pontiella sp. TaxID=2837462 RepID=UPI003565ECF2